MATKLLHSQRLAIGAASVRSTLLAKGFAYAVTASVDCTIRQGGSAVVAVADTADNWFLAKGAAIELAVSDASDGYVAVIAVAGTSGSLYIATLEGSS